MPPRAPVFAQPLALLARPGLGWLLLSWGSALAVGAVPLTGC